MTEPTVSAGYARALIDFAALKGADSARLAEMLHAQAAREKEFFRELKIAIA